jgi:Tol biopolymer transport system component
MDRSVCRVAKLLAGVFLLAITPNTYTQSSPTTPSNGKIAFASDRDGNSEIYVMGADGTGQTRLTGSPEREDYPTWSPDGRQIAFLKGRGGMFSINVMNGDGKNTRQVTALSSELYGMSWSPDGTKIAFHDSTDIFNINIDGTHKVNLTGGQGYNSQPSWSPDGSRIAFVRSVGSYGDIYTMKADGSDLRRVTASPPAPPNAVTSHSPAWSPDGGRLAMMTPQDTYDAENLALVNPDGSDLQFILFPVATPSSVPFNYFIKAPRWSPDGTKLVLYFTDPLTDFSQIWTVHRDGGGLTQLTNNYPNNFNPDWQPLLPVVRISGRAMTPGGSGLRNAVVRLTDSAGLGRTVTTSTLGYYSFDDLKPGASYTIAISSKRYRFLSRSVNFETNVADVDFVGEE